jgi:hypothetical protein
MLQLRLVFFPASPAIVFIKEIEVAMLLLSPNY